jgi:hypothetical protein
MLVVMTLASAGIAMAKLAERTATSAIRIALEVSTGDGAYVSGSAHSTDLTLYRAK